jgi:superfamily I DNA/RNA helicase
MLDFDGMVLTGLALVQEHEWVRRALKAKIPFLAVDEYQDLGVPLHRLVEALCLKGGIRLFAVGDPDQSIYGFTGAEPSLLSNLAESNLVESVHLRLNYRCGSDIISGSTALLDGDRHFKSALGHQGAVHFHECSSGPEEQLKLAFDQIIPSCLRCGTAREPGEIAVLYANQHDGREIAEAACRYGYSYVRFDQGNPWPRNPLNNWLESCAAWCSGGWQTGIPSLYELTQKWLLFHPNVVSESVRLLSRRKLIGFLFANRKPEMLLSEWLVKALSVQLFDYLEREDTMTEEYDGLKVLIQASQEHAEVSKFTVAIFGGQGGTPDHLNLSTIHSAKGLEYDVVIMLGLEEGKIPDFRASTHEAVREERRKFYVALTRARHEVHLLYSGWYENQYGRRFHKGPSLFLEDLRKRLK